MVLEAKEWNTHPWASPQLVAHMACLLWDPLVLIVVCTRGSSFDRCGIFRFRSAILHPYVFLRADRRIDFAFDTSSDMLPRVTLTTVGLEGLQQGSEGPTVIRITRLCSPFLGSSL